MLVPGTSVPSFLNTTQACLYTHVAAPSSINSKRITAKPALEGFGSMCACTEPVRIGIGAVCVEYGRPKWPITMLNHTHKQTPTHKHTHTWYENNVLFFIFGTLSSYDPIWRGFFFLGKPRKKRLASLARLSIITWYERTKRSLEKRNIYPSLQTVPQIRIYYTRIYLVGTLRSYGQYIAGRSGGLLRMVSQNGVDIWTFVR